LEFKNIDKFAVSMPNLWLQLKNEKYRKPEYYKFPQVYAGDGALRSAILSGCMDGWVCV